MSKKSIFDHLNNICIDKIPITENDKGYQPYMINRFVSMTNMYVPMVNEINKFQLPIETHFQYMASILPKRKQFFKYIKKSKETSTYGNDLKCLSKYFEIGTKEAEQYMNFLDKDKIKAITELYRTQ